MLKSDSINTNKPGWMIDNLQLYQPSVIGGINETIKQQLTVFPNPTINKLEVNSVSYPFQSIQIYSVDGVLQQSIQLPLNTYYHCINTNNLANGLYWLDANCNGNHIRQTFVKE